MCWLCLDRYGTPARCVRVHAVVTAADEQPAAPLTTQALFEQPELVWDTED